jgi:hypothetical protein
MIGGSGRWFGVSARVWFLFSLLVFAVVFTIAKTGRFSLVLLTVIPLFFGSGVLC